MGFFGKCQERQMKRILISSLDGTLGHFITYLVRLGRGERRYLIITKYYSCKCIRSKESTAKYAKYERGLRKVRLFRAKKYVVQLYQKYSHPSINFMCDERRTEGTPIIAYYLSTGPLHYYLASVPCKVFSFLLTITRPGWSSRRPPNSCDSRARVALRDKKH